MDGTPLHSQPHRAGDAPDVPHPAAPAFTTEDRWGSSAAHVRRYEPHPRLAPYIRSMIVLDRTGQRTDQLYVLPDDQATLLFNTNVTGRGPAPREGCPQGRLELLGPPTRGYARCVTDVPLTIVVTFRPAGANLIARVAMSELKDRGYDLQEIIGTEAHRLNAALTAMVCEQQRLEALQEFLLERFEGCSRRDLRATRLVDDAIGELRQRYAAGRASESPDGAGAERGERSARQLRRLFSAVVGLNPHTVLRIERFHQALRLAQSAAAPRWADIAARCGYYDQAHMIAEFNAFAGAPPCQLLQLKGSGMPHLQGTWFSELPLPPA